jgi:hypothetical protein
MIWPVIVFDYVKSQSYHISTLIDRNTAFAMLCVLMCSSNGDFALGMGQTRQKLLRMLYPLPNNLLTNEHFSSHSLTEGVALTSSPCFSGMLRAILSSFECKGGFYSLCPANLPSRGMSKRTRLKYVESALSTTLSPCHARNFAGRSYSAAAVRACCTTDVKPGWNHGGGFAMTL